MESQNYSTVAQNITSPPALKFSHTDIASLQVVQTSGDVILCSLLFYIASLIADSYMVPLLESLACKLRMPHNLAGVTLLAVANGAPDIFVSRAVFLKGPQKASLGIGALFGAALVDFLVVFGLVILTCAEEFRNASRPFLRDILFYMIAATAVVYVCNYAKEISSLIAVCLLGVYVVYIVIVVGSRIIRVRYLNETAPGQIPTQEIDFSENPFEHLNPNEAPQQEPEPETVENDSDQDEPAIDLDINFNENDNFERHFQFDDDVQILIIATEPVFNFREEIKHAVRAVFVLSWSNFRQQRTCFSKAVYVVRNVVCTLLNFFVHSPEICGDLQEDSSDDIRFFWCRFSTCVQMFISAHFMAFLILGNKLLESVGIFIAIKVNLIIPISATFIFICILTFCCSKTYQTPKFYFLILLFNFVVCFCLLSKVVDVIAVRVLNFCAIFDIKPVTMGLTVVAWGNSIGDLIANRAMARRGMPRVGVTACFSGPLMNILLALTLSAFTQMIKSGDPIQFEPSWDILFLFSLIVFVCLVLILSALFFKFKFPKYFAAMLIVLYAIIIPSVVILSKLDIETFFF